MPDIALFEPIINSLKESILLFDRRAVVVFVNKSGEELFRRGLRDMEGRRFDDIVPAGGEIARLVRKTIREGRTFRGKSVSLTIAEPRDIDFSLSPFFRHDRIDGAVLSISENMYLADRETYDFDSLIMLIATIAHEIKNPLGGIKGAAQLMRNKSQKACIDESVDLIVRETDRLNAILQDYLTLCRRPSFRPVNVHEVMEKAVAVLRIPIEQGGIELRRYYDPSLPHVRGDEAKLLQVFLNILKNAVEATEGGGKIEISTALSRESFRDHGRIRRWTVISVKDTGKGIGEDELHKIFLPLYTKKKGGTGIGLALSKKVVRDHGGFIKVKSEPGRGTTFLIYIPFGAHA